MEIRLVTISGPSGSGKDTVMKAQLNWLGHLVEPVVSTVTRRARPSDLSGGYEYLNKKEFTVFEELRQFAWVKDFAGEKYGTRKTALDEVLKGGGKIGLMILTPDTITDVKTYAPGKVWSIYLLVRDPAIAEARRRKRQDSEESIKKLVAQHEEWNEFAEGSELFDEFILNEAEDEGRAAALQVAIRVVEFAQKK